MPRWSMSFIFAIAGLAVAGSVAGCDSFILDGAGNPSLSPAPAGGDSVPAVTTDTRGGAGGGGEVARGTHGAGGASGAGVGVTVGYPGCPCTRGTRPRGGVAVAAPGSCPKGTGRSATAIVGRAGGTLSLDVEQSGVPVRLDIPAGALEGSTAVTVTELTVAPPGEYTDYSPLYRFEPVGLALRLPAHLRLPWRNVDGVINRALSVYTSQSADQGFQPVAGGYINAGFMEADITSMGFMFSGYPAALDPAMCNL